MELLLVAMIISTIISWSTASSNTMLRDNCFGSLLILLNLITIIPVNAFVPNHGYIHSPPHRRRHWDSRYATGRNYLVETSVITLRREKSRCHILGSTLNTNSNSRGQDNNDDVITLSEDPQVYLIPNILTAEECQKYMERAEQNTQVPTTEKNNNNKDKSTVHDNDDDDAMQMKRSNAPQATINTSRLWPLPFLCLGAGAPPILRQLLLQQSSPDLPPPSSTEILSLALPPIFIATALTAVLSLAVTQGMQFYARTGATRTSESLALNLQKDVEFINPLVERVGAAVASVTADGRSRRISPPLSWRNWEAPVITRYAPGASFASHNDASPTRGSEWSELGGQRTVTAITYLNTCTEGGGTRFDRLGFTVMPERGSTLVFYPADWETWEADERTVHQGLVAVEEKFIVQMFGRGGERVPPPLGIPDSYGDRRVDF